MFARARPLAQLVSLALVITLSSFNTSREARGETRPQGLELGLFGGYWQGARNVESSAYFGFSAGYHISRVFSLEINQGWISSQAAKLDQLSSSEPELEDYTLNQGAVNFLVNLAAGNFVPYFLVGAGWINTPEDSSWAYDVGLGAKYYLTHDFALRANLAMWSSDFTMRDEPYDRFTLTFGIAYEFRGNRDIDNDRVINPKDKCPTKPEDLDGFQDKDGCAELDNDKDGIKDKDDQCPMEAEDEDGDRDEDGCPDLDDDRDGITNDEDKCPKVAEDKDGFQDDDGCVDEDNDKDGIKDTVDKCPDTPESFNGFQDKDGCPEGDQDRDGIFDAIDRCDAKAETRNGFKDKDGCPDEIPAEMKALLGLQPQLRFRNKSVSFKKKRKAKRRLDLIAAELIKTKLRVIITANALKGDKQALSEKRALELVKLLRERGVSADQLKAVGAADAAPPQALIKEGEKTTKAWVSLTPWPVPKPKIKSVAKPKSQKPGSKTVGKP